MPTTLYYDRLDDGQFPELQIGPGRKGINARVLPPPGDPRIPAPKTATTLLVVFLIDMPPRSADPDAPGPGWKLEFDVPDRTGKPSRQTIALELRPMKGDFVERAPRNPSLPAATGTLLYVGAFWVDVSNLYKERLWRPGMAVELSHGSAQARLVLP